MPSASEIRSRATGGVLQGVTAYHWLVLVLASAGWLFDCTGQRLFVLTRQPALRDLLGAGAADGDAGFYGGLATCILILGWATGGILFGTISDRYGRVKAMVATLLAYSIFNGLSGFASSVTEFLVYRFPCGMGVGGMFGAATTLLAESVPARFRVVALGVMQALSSCGNMLGSALSMLFPPAQQQCWNGYAGWQVLSFTGLAPILLAIPMLLWLREPAAWIEAKERAKAPGDGRAVGRVGDLFADPRWRRHTILGVCLGLAGMVGLWGIAFHSPELITTALRATGHSAAEIDAARARGTLLQDLGSLVGMLTFTFLAARVSRRGAFLCAFLLCIVSVPFVFHSLKSEADMTWMLPIMGFGTLACFAGYSIYFPELFPTRLRGTGVGFCYNTVRYLTAPFPFLLGWLATLVPFRTVAVGMSAIYLVGIVALVWAPETKGKPLPED